MGPPQRHPTDEPPSRAWLRLHEHPFEGEWVALSWDWAETLPCAPEDLAWARLWIAIRSPNESALASAIFEEIARRRLELAPKG